MQNMQSMWIGLDEKARADVAAEQQYHERRIAEIITRESVGAWPYTLSDENERHGRLLLEIFLAARRRLQQAN